MADNTNEEKDQVTSDAENSDEPKEAELTDTDEQRHERRILASLVSVLVEIRALSEMLPITMTAIADHRKADLDRWSKIRDNLFKDENCEEVQNDDGTVSKRYKIEANQVDELRDFTDALDNINRVKASFSIIPRAFLNTLVSQYDAFLGLLIADYYREFPESLDASDKTVQFSEVVQADDIADIRESIIEREVDSVMRGDHAAQVEWLEKRAGCKIIEHIRGWDRFIEIVERRHLFTHNDGVVNKQYLRKTSGLKVKTETEVGTRLSVGRDYFEDAVTIFIEVTVNIFHRFWRKLDRLDTKSLNDQLLDLGYTLLCDEAYAPAKIVYEFALSPGVMKSANERWVLVNEVNYSVALRDSDCADDCKKRVENIDWSACREEFLLAKSILIEEYDEAVELMRKIGTAGYPSETDYLTWPLFRHFRETEQFKTAFSEIFGSAIDKPESEKYEGDDLFDGISDKDADEKSEVDAEVEETIH